MSLFRLQNKYPSSQFILKTLTSRLFATGKTDPIPFPEEPTSAYYDELIYNAGRSGDMETVREVLDKRIKDGFFNTTNTFRFLSNRESSVHILEPLKQALARVDKGFSRKNAFDSLIIRLCKLNWVEEALLAIEAMARAECALNPVSFHPILNVLARKNRMEEAWRVMDLMRDAGVSPDLKAYNYLLSSFCYKGDLKAADEVLRKMEEEGMKADMITYDAVVQAACKAGKVERAIRVFRRMVDEGMHVNYSTYMHVINALLKLEYYELAVEFVMIFAGMDQKLDTEIFGILASKLIDLARIDEAMLLLQEMNRRRLEMGPKLRLCLELNSGEVSSGREDEKIERK